MILNGSNFALQETFGNIWRYFVLSQLEGEFAIVTSWVEDSDDAKHSTRHRMAPYTVGLFSPKSTMLRLRNTGLDLQKECKIL